MLFNDAFTFGPYIFRLMSDLVSDNVLDAFNLEFICAVSSVLQKPVRKFVAFIRITSKALCFLIP